MAAKVDIYQMITDLIVKQMESGVVPWRIPWKGPTLIPMNMVSKKKYKGLNLWALNAVAQIHDCPFFLSFNQAKMLGGNIKSGSKGYPIVFWTIFKSGEAGEEKTFPMLRYYTVFNFKQTENIPENKLPVWDPFIHEFNAIAQADLLVEGWEDKPLITYAGDRAFYSPANDTVTMPAAEHFFEDEHFYSTQFHELIHSTGHRSRTGRHSLQVNHSFGSADYSQEELVAEMGASFICGILGIEQAVIEQSASYITSWLSKLKGDKKFLMQASSQAQKAVDYILGHQKDPAALTAFTDYIQVEEEFFEVV